MVLQKLIVLDRGRGTACRAPTPCIIRDEYILPDHNLAPTAIRANNGGGQCEPGAGPALTNIPGYLRCIDEERYGRARDPELFMGLFYQAEKPTFADQMKAYAERGAKR